MTSVEIKKIVSDAWSTKPNDLIIGENKWKALIWTALKGKNALVLGPTRCGKTKSILSVVDCLKRRDKFFVFNMGSTQDARATLIGNTFYNAQRGVFFNSSPFVKAITTPNAVVLLDEISRSHHDGWNILMPVLDPTQRYLRLDESETSQVVYVDPSVTFFATANVGVEYTATNVFDKAILSRFPVKVEMDPLQYEDEMALIHHRFPNVNSSEKATFESICKIAQWTRAQMKLESPKISTFIPTGLVLEMSELIMDGFSLNDIAEVSIYPEYSADGGVESERTFMKQYIQKYQSVDGKSPINDPIKPIKSFKPKQEEPLF